MIKPKNLSSARYAALMGMLFAAASALNMVESAFSSFLPAGMRIGLSNIVIMTAILCLNLPSALLLAILKAALVFMTRGAAAGAMSLFGTLAAFSVTALLFRKTQASYVLISVLGAIAHSCGQLCAARLIFGAPAVFAYAPLLAVSSTIAGICTGIVLKTVLPPLKARLAESVGKK